MNFSGINRNHDRYGDLTVLMMFTATLMVGYVIFGLGTLTDPDDSVNLMTIIVTMLCLGVLIVASSFTVPWPAAIRHAVEAAAVTYLSGLLTSELFDLFGANASRPVGDVVFITFGIAGYCLMRSPHRPTQTYVWMFGALIWASLGWAFGWFGPVEMIAVVLVAYPIIRQYQQLATEGGTLAYAVVSAVELFRWPIRLWGWDEDDPRRQAPG